MRRSSGINQNSHGGGKPFATAGKRRIIVCAVLISLVTGTAFTVFPASAGNTGFLPVRSGLCTLPVGIQSQAASGGTGEHVLSEAASADGGTGVGKGDEMDDDYFRRLDFISPPARFRMMKLLYSFDKNYKVAADMLSNTYGYGGITTNVPFNDRYLKDETEFALLDEAFGYCLSGGLPQLWIYDEYQWPSGSAYGLVTEGNPEYRPEGLAMIRRNGSGKSNFTLPGDYSAIKYAYIETPAGTEPVEFTGRRININAAGGWTLFVFATYDAWVERATLNPWQKGRPYINIMSKGAVEKFVSLTHDHYKRSLTGSFSSVEAFFTDEPSLFVSNMTNPIHTGGELPVYLVPWEASLPDVFRDMHGYELLPAARSLFEGDTVEDKTVRIHFYETVARLVSENYFGTITDWCRANGTVSSGHLLLEEKLAYHVVLYGNFLKCLNRQGMPGCDLLHVSPSALMDPNSYVGSFVAVKLASSSARNTGKEHVMAEFNPAAIGDPEFEKDPYRASLAGAVITRMYGADKFVMLNPQESYNAAQARALNDAVGRLNVLLEGAQMNSGLGVYYPIADAQSLTKADSVYSGERAALSESFNRLCLNLLTAGYDYNYIDDDTVLNAELEGGRLVTGDTFYDAIIMPYVDFLSFDVLEKLDRFEKAGGTVIYAGRIPRHTQDTSRLADFQAITEKYSARLVRFSDTDISGILDILASSLDTRLSLGEKDGAILVSPYKIGNKQLLVALNISDKTKTFTPKFFGDSPETVVYNVETGAVRTVGNGDPLLIAAREPVVLLYETDETENSGATPEDRPAEKTPLPPDSGTGEKKDSPKTRRTALIACIAGCAAVLAAAVTAAILLIREKRKTSG